MQFIFKSVKLYLDKENKYYLKISLKVEYSMNMAHQLFLLICVTSKKSQKFNFSSTNFSKIS